MTEWTPITDDDVTTLNAARDALKEIKARAVHAADQWEAGQLHAVADTAEWQIFQTLNHASCYSDLPLDENVLHNRKEITSHGR